MENNDQPLEQEQQQQNDQFNAMNAAEQEAAAAAAAAEAAAAEAAAQAAAQTPVPVNLTIQQALEMINGLKHALNAQLRGSSSIKLQIQSPDVFYGKPKENVTRWLFQLEQYFRAANEERDHRRVAYAATLLRKGAEVWWESTCRNASEDESACTWEQFKKLITDEFVDPNKEIKARRKWKDLKQLGSMAEYQRIFQEVAMDIIDLTEKDKVAKFYEGLKPDIKTDINKATMGEPYTLGLSKIMKFASTFDAADYQDQQDRRMQAGRGRGPAPAPAANTAGPIPMEVGSVERIPKLTDEERARCRREGLCLACREGGHIAANCPKFPRKKVVNFDLPNGDRQ